VAGGALIAAFGTSLSGMAINLPASSGLAAVCSAGVNGALSISTKSEPSTGTQGPFTATIASPGDNIGDLFSVLPEGF